MSWISRLCNGRSTSQCSDRPSRRASLFVEPLEDRCLLSGGTLDPTFGTAGIVTNTVGTSSQAFAVSTYQNAGTANDGKIVVAGHAFPATGKAVVNIAVARYNLDGTLDPTFGGTGAVLSGPGRALGVQIQPDGKIVAAGASGGDFVVVRYNTNGSLDTSFGFKGKVITTIGKNSNDSGEAMVLQPDGKIVVAGETAPTNSNFVDLALVRYNANGALDASFGTAGKLTTRFSSPLIAGYTNSVVSLALDPTSGKFVVAAQTHGISFVTRINTNGTPDATFGSATGHPGYVNVGMPYNPTAAVQPDGRVVVTGVVTLASGVNAIGLNRLNPDGTPDMAFGTGGFVVTSNSADDNIARAVTTLANGDILVGGDQISIITGGRSFMAARYHADGNLDTTFGVHGIATGGSNGNGRTTGLAVEPDGRIVMAGALSFLSGSVFSVARFLATGPQISAFTASPNPLAAGGSLTLTAADVAGLNPGSSVTGVAFYRDANGDGVLQPDADFLLGYGIETSEATWSLTFSTAGMIAGNYLFFAIAEDSFGVLGDPLATTVDIF